MLLWHRPWHQHSKVSTNESSVSGLVWTNERAPLCCELNCPQYSAPPPGCWAMMVTISGRYFRLDVTRVIFQVSISDEIFNVNQGRSNYTEIFGLIYFGSLVLSKLVLGRYVFIGLINHPARLSNSNKIRPNHNNQIGRNILI